MADRHSYDAFPISLNQQNIWNLEQAFPGTPMNNISTTVRMRGHVDFLSLTKAIHMVLESDPSLRTRLTVCNGEPMQYIVPFETEEFPIYDFTHSDLRGVDSWEAAVTSEVMALIDAPLYRFLLFRTGEDTGGMLVKLHHIISDGWSQMKLCNKICQAYLDLLEGDEVVVEAAPSYQLHVEEQQKYLQSRAYNKDEKYWQRMLKQRGQASALKQVKGAMVSPVGKRISYKLSERLNHAIYSFCVNNRVAPFAVFYMALAIYLKRTGGEDHFTIGVPVFNRTNFVFKQSGGMFVSTLPFVGEIDENWSFSEFNTHMMESWLEMLRHQRFPYTDITRLAAQEQAENGPLFHIALSYQDSKMLDNHDTPVSFEGKWHYSGFQSEQLCIHLSNWEDVRHYAVNYDYLTQLFREQEISRLHESLVGILEEALADPEKPIHALSVLTPAEKEEVLYRFNGTETPLRWRSLRQAWSEVVKRYPSRAAIIDADGKMTYEQLDRRANAVCEAIRGHMGEDKALVAVLLPRSPQLFAAMVGILQAGCAWMILPTDLPVKRLQMILEQSGAKLLLTKSSIMRDVGLDMAGLPKGLQTIEMCHLRDGSGQMGQSSLEDLAYVVYTSGSTGQPKGVEITQGNLLNLVQGMSGIYGKGAVLSVCSIGFDAFLLESAVALLNARTIVLPTDEEQESPSALAALVRRYGVGSMLLTPSRLLAFLKNRDFSRVMDSMECILCGGESFPGELLGKLRSVSRARIYNQYGPSETTVAVSLKEMISESCITAGKPMNNCRLYVLDPWKNPLPAGVCGELYIGGACVGRGYRGMKTLTAEHFMEDPFCVGGRMYRTGDLAYWTEDGEICLVGRVDSQVKLRGLRIELTEVADCLALHPEVTAAAAKVYKQGDQEMLVAYYSGAYNVPEVDLIHHMAAYLPYYMLPACILRVAEIPLTGNGKVDESCLPDPGMVPAIVERSVMNQAEASPVLQTVLQVFRQVLDRPALTERDDYFLHGGDSLNAMETLSILEEKLGRRLRIADLHVCRTAARMASYISGEPVGTTMTTQADAMATTVPLVGAVEITARQQSSVREIFPVREEYPLTPIQQGMYVQTMMDPEGLSYHMPGAFGLSEPLDADRLERAFRCLIQEDPIFRTCFVQNGTGICAKVMPQVEFTLERLQGETLEEVAAGFLRPFALDQASLLRAGLWTNKEGHQVLWLDSHHIIGDGMSTPLVLQRLSGYYEGQTVAMPAYSYLDHAWKLEEQKKQKDIMTGGGQQESLSYWREHFAQMPEALELPTDHSRPHPFDYKGATYRHVMSEAVSCRIHNYIQEHGLTAYTLFLAAFGVLLAEISGKRRLTVGTPVSGRRTREERAICGPFLDTLPLILAPDRAATVAEYLQSVQTEVTGMLDHADCSLEEIITALGLRRSVGENPMYQVMLSMRPFAVGQLALSGSALEYLPVGIGTAKQEMTVEAAYENGHYECNIEYGTSLFTEETIAFYSRCLETILDGIVSGRAKQVGDLPLMASQDRIRLMDEPIHAYTPFLNMPLPRQIEARVQQQPDQTAVIFHGEHTTYGQLDEMACRYALQLKNAGVLPGDRVGLAMARTPRLYAAMLAVLKNGCAYVPFLTDFPEKRISYMLEMAGAQKILCDPVSYDRLPMALKEQAVVICDEGPAQFVSEPVSSEDLIHILFTSGSTGKPKGVMIRHRSLSNLLHTSRTMYADVEGPMIAATTLIFDIFASESLIPLALGKTIALADEQEMLLPWELGRLIRETGAQFIQFTASRLQMCLTNDAFCQAIGDLRFTIVGGEAVPEQLVKRFKQYCQGRLVNLYGPTEATVYTTMIDLNEGDPITIGRPMPNMRVYILDEEGRHVLPTACGEMYLAGEGVAVGYVGRPDLTEKSFLPDRYFPGQTMYRSGDLGRLRVDGTIDFIGRADSQVKIDGQRVELEEIRCAMLESGLASQAVPVPVKNQDGSVELCAFYVKEKGREQETEAEMQRYLSSCLTKYMVPARLFAMEELPKTPGGKADLQTLTAMARGEIAMPAAKVTVEPEVEDTVAALPEISGEEETMMPEEQQPQAVAEEYHEVTAQELLTIWEEVLGRCGLQADVSFFEQGGTSLGVLSVLSYYFNKKINLTMEQFYDHPTAEAQAALLQKEMPEATVDIEPVMAVEPVRLMDEDVTEQKSVSAEPSKMDVKKVAPAKKAPVISSRQYPAVVPQGTSAFDRLPSKVVLTGVTGYFGVHLLKELLAAGVETVICLTRDGNAARVEETLTWYFGAEGAAAMGAHIRVLQGDLTRPYLGMRQRAFYGLALEAEAIYHCAADVRHYVSREEDMMDCNVEGTKTMVALAMAGEIPLFHISTASLSGEYRPGCPVVNRNYREEDFDIGQNWQDNIYTKSKFLAEAAVYEAMEQGLNAHVFRLGRLVGRTSDGVFQRNPDTNAAYLLLQAIAKVNALPESMAGGTIDLTPVDWCAAAVVALSKEPETTWHMLHPEPISLGEALEDILPELQIVEDGEFSKILETCVTEENRQKLAPLMNQWNQIQQIPTTITPVCRRTAARLRQLGFDHVLPGPEQLLGGFCKEK